MQTTQAVTDNVAGKRSIQQKEFDGISNAAVVQIISGLTCIGLQVYLYVNYRTADQTINDGNTIFTLAVGSFGLIAGIFGCLTTATRKWLGFLYVATSLAVVGSSVLYFLAGYWDFYDAVKDSGKFYYASFNGDDANQLETPLWTAEGEFQFWMQAGLFLCVIVLALFSLAGMAVVASYRFCNRGSKKEDYRSLLID